MAKGYWIAAVDVQNPDAYKNYVAANGAAFAKFGGRFLVRGGPRREVVEQEPRPQRRPRVPVLRGRARLLELARVQGRKGQAGGRRRR